MKKDNFKKSSVVLAAVISLTVILSTLLLKVTGSYTVYFDTAKRQLPIYGVERSDKKIAISFDCAWGTDYTDKLLDTMDKYNVKCTFFMVEFWAEKYPEYVKKISERGHEIGTHSATHSYMSKLSESKIIEELNSSSKAISDVTGKEVKLFRPPYGDYNDRLVTTASSLGFYTIQWNVDSLDWKDLSAEDIAMRVISRTKSGSIILCHNNGLHTAESLPLIFTDLINKGYEFVPIGELIYYDNCYIDVDGTQKLSDDN